MASFCANPSLIELHLANMSSPINRIPEELLVMIYEHVTQVDRGSFAYTMDGEPERHAYIEARGAVRLTHVCRHWRQTALESPILWTRIDGRSSERLNTFLQRARKLPVSLYADVDAEDLDTILHTVPAEQLRRLDLHLEPKEEYIVPLISWSAPNLECLTMDAPRDDYPNAAKPLGRLQLLDGQADALKALALQFVGTWVPSNTFPSLTHLHLSFAFRANAQTHDLLSVLSNTPNLEFLLIDQQFYRRDDLSSIAGPVVLSKLKLLTLARIAYTRVMNLLRYLSIPEQCFVRCHDVVINPAYGEGAPGPLVETGPLRHATRLDLGPAIEYEFFLVVESEAAGFSMWAHMDDDESSWDSWFHGLPAMINVSTITSLHITIHATHTFWSTVLRHMTAVTELKAVIGRIRPTLPHPSDTFCALLSEEPILLPSLQDVYVQGFYCSGDIATSLSGLVDAVAFRAPAGHRLRRLVIQPDLNASQAHNLVDQHTAELAGLVDGLEVLGPGPDLCGFEVRDLWQVDGQDRYWREDSAEFKIPKITDTW